MPLNWTIDHDLRLVTARAEGALSSEDVKTSVSYTHLTLPTILRV